MNEKIYKSIKEKTNLKIGFVNYERENLMRKKVVKNLMIAVIALGIFLSGVFTVNALTDNSIGNAINDTVKNVLKVKIDSEDYNAKCEEKEDGTLVCSFDSGNLKDSEVIIKNNDSSSDSKVELEFNTD